MKHYVANHAEYVDADCKCCGKRGLGTWWASHYWGPDFANDLCARCHDPLDEQLHYWDDDLRGDSFEKTGFWVCEKCAPLATPYGKGAWRSAPPKPSPLDAAKAARKARRDELLSGLEEKP